MRYGTPDRVPYFEEGLREGVIDVWRTQGLPKDADLSKIFSFDRREELEPDLDPRPDLQGWPTSRSELDLFRRNLDPNDPGRLPENWPERVRAWKDRDHVLTLWVHRGFFLSMGVRGWRRFTEVIFLLKDDPQFIREAMAIRGEFSARLADNILRDVDIDAAVFVEPIGGNDRPLISPQMYEEFVLTNYEPVLEAVRQHGVDTIILLTFANPRPLIPSILKWGFNCLWGSEVNMETMDYRDLRREFGRDLRLIGGIDLDALRIGREAIRREVEEKVPPLLAEGGYIPLADGRVREDMPFENYVYYRKLLAKVTQE
ncbi:MAG: uroporphyrinogen decarboxylase family protein [Desulfobacteraceae bacterium]|jgi:uroporphyrinogen decarboxylase